MISSIFDSHSKMYTHSRSKSWSSLFNSLSLGTLLEGVEGSITAEIKK